MSPHHAAVWIDHKEAKIFQIELEGFDISNITTPHQHVTRKADEHGRHTEQHGFFHDVAAFLKGADELLILGPASAKLDFIRHLQRHDHALEAKVVGVETLDHPTDAQLVAYVRQHFKAKFGAVIGAESR
ncbi:MAG: translational machinery protein [Polyangiaceae bacterium]